MSEGERVSLANSLKAWSNQAALQVAKSSVWDPKDVNGGWRTVLRRLAECLGETTFPLPQLQGTLIYCMNKNHQPPSPFYGEEEVDDLLKRIKELVNPDPDPDGVGGELSWRHHGGDLAFKLQDVKQAAMEFAQNTVAKVRKSVKNVTAKTKESVENAKEERRVHRQVDIDQAEQHRMEGFTQAEKRLASLFQPPPGWPWG